MFKGFKLRKMTAVANQVLEENKDAFSKFDTEIIIENKPYLHHVQRISGVDYISAITFTGRTNCGLKGRNELKQLHTATFCMNSMYVIAKTLKKDPELLVVETIETFCECVRNGVYPTTLCVPEYIAYDVKKKVM